MKNCSNLLITNFRVQIKVRQKNSEGELQEMTCEMNEEFAIFLNSPNGGGVMFFIEAKKIYKRMLLIVSIINYYPFLLYHVYELCI